MSQVPMTLTFGQGQIFQKMGKKNQRTVPLVKVKGQGQDFPKNWLNTKQLATSYWVVPWYFTYRLHT